MRTMAFTLAAVVLATATGAGACPYHTASATPIQVADDSAPAKGTDTTAFPNSPNGTPATGENGKPVVTDHAACGAVQGTKCDASPQPSSKADTSDTTTSETTVNKKAP